MKTVYYLITISLLCFSCTEKTLEPITASKGKPAIVTDVSTTAIPGGVEINYQIPNAEDILEVKAVFVVTNGQTKEAATSFYGSRLTLEGFNDTNEHEALVYTVNRAQVRSDAVSVKFTPLESPLSKTAESTRIISDFGGANFSWRNEDKALLTFEFLTTDAAGNMQIRNIISSNLDSTAYTLRGYLPEPRKFAMIIRDNFDNVSEPIYPAEGLLTPFVEERLDKKIMSVIILSNDMSFNNWGYLNEMMIDDDISNFGHTADGTMPDVSFTLNLGKTAQLSRLIIHQRASGNGGNNNFYYNYGNPLLFTVYGRATEPSSDGNWNEWTKIMDCTVIKPSGEPRGQNSEDDIMAAIAGHEFSFPAGSEELRYLRFLFHTSWGNAIYMHVGEVTCYGKYAE